MGSGPVRSRAVETGQEMATFHGHGGPMSGPGLPHGVPCWIEHTGDAAAFAAATFGWEVDDGVARLGGAVVAGLGPLVDDGAGPARWATAVSVDDAEAAADAVESHGGEVLRGPVLIEGRAVVAACLDPSGVPFGLWEPAGAAGAEAVNVPGTWNWSDLATDDPEGAATFYGAVFGWRAVPLPAFGATMWQLPGYGDHLDTLDPGRRERHDAPGVPPGFGDAVGWLHEPGAAGPGWVVTFAVADTDAVVARARAGGATVVEAAHDLGPTRLAVLADPTGARFTVSCYQPG